MGIILMAIAGCAAVLAVASSDEENRTMRNRGDALLSTSSGTSQVDVTSVIKSAGMQSVMQELLAVVEGKNHGDGQTISWNEGGQPVELEQAAAASTAPCDASCKQKKVMIAQKMKSLRDQINRDFSSMINFGHKAGYLPPPQSIRQEVMDGTLLGGGSKTGANAVPPPPFSEKVSPKLLKAASLSSAPPPAATASAPAAAASPAAPAPAAAATSAPAAVPAAVPAPVPAAAAAVPPPPQVAASLDTSDSADAAPAAGGGGKTSSAWAKAFSFMKSTNNPVDGNSQSHADVQEHHSTDKKGDPLKSAEKDKFLRDFEDPVSLSTKKKADASTDSDDDDEGSSADSSGSGKDSPTSFLKKGSDPLKSAETDKFLAGFLG